MAVLPIDLQALYAQSLAVGQEQAALKDAPAAAQAAQGQAIARQTQEDDHSVGTAQDVGDGAEQTDPDGEGPGTRRRRAGRRTSEPEPTPPLEVVGDPELGQHIDVVG